MFFELQTFMKMYIYSIVMLLQSSSYSANIIIVLRVNWATLGVASLTPNFFRGEGGGQWGANQPFACFSCDFSKPDKDNAAKIGDFSFKVSGDIHMHLKVMPLKTATMATRIWELL